MNVCDHCRKTYNEHDFPAREVTLILSGQTRVFDGDYYSDTNFQDVKFVVFSEKCFLSLIKGKGIGAEKVPAR